MAAPDATQYNDWLVKNYRFVVNIGKEKLGFSKVSGLEYSVEYDTIQEGGINDRVHTLTRPRTKPHTLVLEKGSGQAGKVNKLIVVGRRITAPVSILLYQYDPGKKAFVIYQVWTFDQGIVTKWEASSLDAMSSEIVIDRFEIAHSGLYLEEISQYISRQLK